MRSSAPFCSSFSFVCTFLFCHIFVEDILLPPKPTSDGSPSSRCAMPIRTSQLAHQIEVFRTFKIRWTRTTTPARGRSRDCDPGCHSNPKTNTNIKVPTPNKTVEKARRGPILFIFVGIASREHEHQSLLSSPH